jgi:ATP-binding cassette subfamily C protein
VLIDGQALQPGVADRWRAGIGYVAQDVWFFHDTIRRNLIWAQPGVDDASLWMALEQSAAAEFVRMLPRGLDTIMGDRGVLLSGGERQRLALARALVRHPQLLILDEATSALDAENEARIVTALRQLKGQVTIVLITHRLTLAREADVVHVIETGRLVESGGWPELVSRPASRLRALWHAARDGTDDIAGTEPRTSQREWLQPEPAGG